MSVNPSNQTYDADRLYSELLGELSADIHGRPVASRAPYPFETGWRLWLPHLLPQYMTDKASGALIPFGEHHADFWDWAWSLELGTRSLPQVCIWPRGGAKSTSCEMAGVLVGALNKRRYVLYISETQKQAEDHLQNVAGMLESPMIARYYPEVADRLLSKYGTSKGWMRNRVRCASGFTVDAIGLDVAARGIKLDDARPDLMIIDDVDGELDTGTTTSKKISILTKKFLPAGSSDLAVLAVQNLIHPDSIFSQLADGRADFLHGRQVSGPFPAVRDLEVEQGEDHKYVITGGRPIWQGMDLSKCQDMINRFGLRAFLSESQQEVQNDEDAMFRREWFHIVDTIPAGARKVRYWDLAASEAKAGKNPDWTAGALLAEYQGRYYICDLFRFRRTPQGVEDAIQSTAVSDGLTTDIWMEQEPGSSGVNTIDHYARRVLRGYGFRPNKTTGPKAARAKPLSSAAEMGNVSLLRGAWNGAFLEEACSFPGGIHDDQVDAASGAFERLNASRITGNRTAVSGPREVTNYQPR